MLLRRRNLGPVRWLLAAPERFSHGVQLRVNEWIARCEVD